jgi:hypothetical protein
MRAVAAALGKAPPTPGTAVADADAMADSRAKTDAAIAAARKAVADERAKLEQDRLDFARETDTRSDVLALAQRALGRDWSSRIDGKPDGTPKTLDAIKREIVDKVDSARLAEIDSFPEAQRAVVLDVHVAQVRKVLDARANKGPDLLKVIEQTRDDGARGPELTPEQKAMADRLAQREAKAAGKATT